MAKIWQEGQRKETEAEKHERITRNKMRLAEPYELKVRRAEQIVEDWEDTCGQYGKTCAVSVGGLDSITLLAFVRKVLGRDVMGISVSSLEDRTIQAVHAEMGVEIIKPLKSKVQVLKEFGYPIISKQTSAKISRLQTPGDTSPIIKAYMTGVFAVNVKCTTVGRTAIEGAAADDTVCVALDTLGCHAHLLACQHHIQFPTLEAERLCHIDALGIISGTLHIEDTACHGDVIVCLHASATC